MVIIQPDTHCLCHGIQLKPVQSRQEKSGHSHRICVGKLPLYAKKLTVSHDKAHIKIGIVSNQRSTLTELHKFRQDHFDGLGICHHSIVDPRQILDSERNRHPGIDKLGKTGCNLPLFHPDGTDLYYFIFHRGKTGGLYIKNNKITVNGLTFGTIHDILQIVHKISLYAVDHLEIIVGNGIIGVTGLWKSLYYTVICHRHRRMAPGFGPLDYG